MVFTSTPLLSLLIIFPVCGALFCLTPLFSAKLDPKGWYAWIWALGVAGLQLATLGVLYNFVGSGFVSSGAAALLGPEDAVLGVREVYPWLPSLGISFSLTLDGLSYVFTLLTALVTFICILWAKGPSSPQGGDGAQGLARSSRAWYGMFLAAQACVTGAFLATDLVLFYVFYEVMLLPVLVGICLWGGVGRLAAAYKFALYTLAGTVLMFLAIVFCGWTARTHGVFSFEVSTLVAADVFSPKQQVLLGAAFLLAFLVKIPGVPFHSWMPGAYREAPHGVAAFMAALLGKVGLYGILRFVAPLFPAVMGEHGETLAAIGAVGVVYGALVALYQTDLRLLLAYSSLSHLGFCILGIAAQTTTGGVGAVFQGFSHGIVTAGLFLIVGHLIDLRQSKSFVDFGGLAHRLPRNATLLMIFSLGSVALPLTSSFVGEFLILMGAYTPYPVWTCVAMAGVVLGAVYTLTAYLRIMFGVDRCLDVPSGADLSGVKFATASALAALVVVLGIFPAPILQVIEPALGSTYGADHTAMAQMDPDMEETFKFEVR
jgi:NADH-quinone oxidoreductase subunit M